MLIAGLGCHRNLNVVQLKRCCTRHENGNRCLYSACLSLDNIHRWLRRAAMDFWTNLSHGHRGEISYCCDGHGMDPKDGLLGTSSEIITE